jgi:8-oxo-dGTP pyrophosphatase MutT (NUDIX family)
MTTIADNEKIKSKMTSAAGIVYRKDDNGQIQVLIIARSADDHWPLFFEFPRGKCDKPPGEDKIKCLKREVKEETGLDVTPVKFLGTFEYLADNGTRLTTCFNYLCKMDNPKQEVKLSKEHDFHEWISQAGQAELMLMPDQAKMMIQVLSKDNPIYNIPENDFTTNNRIEEYLKIIQ